MTFRAIILAAGKNSRLQDYANDVPKCLLPLNSSTILERQIDFLTRNGFRREDVVIVSGHMADKIRVKHDNLLLNKKYKETDNAYSLHIALDYLQKLSGVHNEDKIFVFDCDLIYDENLISKVLNADYENLLVTRSELLPVDSKEEVVLAEKTGKIKKIFRFCDENCRTSDRTKLNPSFVYTGILKMSNNTAKKLNTLLCKKNRWSEWYTIAFSNLFQKVDFFNFPLPKKSFCFDVDTKEDYEKIHTLLGYNSQHKRKRYLLFTAGPVNVTKNVKKSMVYSEIGHRESEFSTCLKDVRKKLLTLFNANPVDFSVVVINGSGTAAMESVLISSLHKDKKILVVNNGDFGDRITEICRLYGLGLNNLSFGWGASIDLKAIEDSIKKDKDIETVAMVLLETSTGMVNPVEEVGYLCKKYNKTFIVDAISGLGGENINVVDDNIDFCISNTNKCLSGLPVLSFVCARRSAVERIRNVKPRGFYLDFLKHYDYEENLNQTPFTPQIPLFFMLRAAINELLEEGVQNRIKRYHDNSLLLREKLEEMGFKFQLERTEMSNVMTNVLVPKGISYAEIHSRLKQKGYIIYPGKGQLNGKIMHIANVGILKKGDVLRFCTALQSVLGRRNIEY